MSTNPNSLVRLHSRNNGRASVYEANQWAQAYSTGVLNGTPVKADTGLNVTVAGSQSEPVVVIGQNAMGYKISLDLVASTTIALTAPVSNSKVVAIVAYTDDLAIESTDQNVTGNPSSCGLIAVNGTTAASPVAPDDAAIRQAITSDGATGSQAVYAIIATILVDSSTSDITDSLITLNRAGIGGGMIDDGSITSQKLDWTTINGANVIRLGDKKIMWGAITISNAASGTDATGTITFPESFNTAPKITVTCKSWIAIRGIFAYDTGTASSKVGVYHTQGNSVNVGIDWIAIG